MKFLAKIFLIGTMLTLFVGTQAAQAQEIGLGTNKNRFDVDSLAGQTYQDDVVVYNQSNIPLPVHIELSLWNLKPDSEDIEFITADPSFNATTWFTITPADFILDASGPKKIHFEIKVPKDAPLGSYLVMMRFQPTLPEQYFSEAGPRFIPELGVLFFINVKSLSLDQTSGYSATVSSLGPENQNRITLLNTIIPTANAAVFDQAVNNVIAQIKNTGTYYFKSAGTIEIKNMFGRTVLEKDLPERYLLPGSVRTIPIAVAPDAPGGGQFAWFKQLLYQLGQQTYFGSYTATMRLKVPGQPDIVSSIGFWVIPWKFWTIVAAAGLLIVLMFTKFRGRLQAAFAVLLRRS